MTRISAAIVYICNSNCDWLSWAWFATLRVAPIFCWGINTTWNVQLLARQGTWEGSRTFKNKKNSLYGTSYCKIPPVTSETGLIKICQEIIFFVGFFFFWQLLVSVVSQLTMELGTIRALSYVLELLSYKWQILSFVRCQNIEMKDWSKLSQNSHRLKRITWISDGVIQFLSNILPVSHFNPVKPAAQRQRYPCGKNPDWHVPPFIQGVVPHEFWEMINGKKHSNQTEGDRRIMGKYEKNLWT